MIIGKYQNNHNINIETGTLPYVPVSIFFYFFLLAFLRSPFLLINAATKNNIDANVN